MRAAALALVLATVGALAVGAGSASAHTTCTYHAGGDYACLLDRAEPFNVHESIIGCDEDVDGNYAYIRWWRNGVLQPPRYDPDGAGGSCAVVSRSSWSPGLESYNICVQNEGCGRPVYASEF